MANRQPDIRKLAQRQRWLIWLVLISMLTQFSPLLPWGQFHFALLVVAGALQILCYVSMVVGVILLLTARDTHPIWIILNALLMIAPCANMLTLILVNSMVTRTLKKSGLRVGLMGVDPDEVERILNPDLCKTCGYNLTGNQSGTCPECGTEVDRASSQVG